MPAFVSGFRASGGRILADCLERGHDEPGPALRHCARGAPWPLDVGVRPLVAASAHARREVATTFVVVTPAVMILVMIVLALTILNVGPSLR